MSDEEIDAENDLTTEQLRLLAALHEIASDSDEGETVRTAMSALTGTNIGLNYIITHPLVV
jgi:hypothetical protein